MQRWVETTEVDGGRRFGATSREAAEKRELRKRVKLLEQEVEILGRAAVYLSQANLPGRKVSTRS